jgi:cytochrome P450
MRSAIYYLCRNPGVYAKLLEEIDSFHQAGDLSEYITYAEAMRMPYTIGTIKEAMRVCPSAALTYPRHVPKGGATISGHFFTEGVNSSSFLHGTETNIFQSRVGVNPYVLHFNTEIFGHDAEDFNPGRWLRPNAKMMDSYMFQFGKGSRKCIGQNIAIVELYKFIPQFLRAFKVELVNPEKKVRRVRPLGKCPLFETFVSSVLNSITSSPQTALITRFLLGKDTTES